MLRGTPGVLCLLLGPLKRSFLPRLLGFGLDFVVVPTESGFHVSFSSVSGVECFLASTTSNVSSASRIRTAAAPCSNLNDGWLISLINVFLY